MGISHSFGFVSSLFHISALFIHFSQLKTNLASRAGLDLTEGPSYFFYQHSEYPRDCQEILNHCSASNSFSSGVYLIKPDGYPEPFEVFCDGGIESKAWTVIQRRIDGSVDFKRSWTEYTEGFGFPSSEVWIGNEKLSFLSNQKTYELQIDMINAAGSSFFVHYDRFRISDDWGEFKLGSIGEYSGNASSVTSYCSANMEYGNCSCQAMCSGGCQRKCKDAEETCICPNGFFLDQDSNCVSEEECGCYREGFGLIQDGDSKINSDCSRKCSCNNNQLSCVNIQCSSDATCQEILSVYQCRCNEGFQGDGLICTRPNATMSDCFDLYMAGNTADGVYTINPYGLPGSYFQVYCDMTTDGGGWTVFQRRVNGTESFYRDWNTYKAGFGPLRGNHWLGNDNLHAITRPKDYQLRVDIVDSVNSSYYALYDLFRISNESDNYRLLLGSYNGTAENDFSLSDGYAFSTYDQDNDFSSNYNCAELHKSGWWHTYELVDDIYYCWTLDQYFVCTGANINGEYSGRRGENIFWVGLPGNECNILKTEMKLRPI